MFNAVIIVPCWNEAGNVRRLCDALSEVASRHELKLLVRFIDDGSDDSTWFEIQAAIQEYGEASDFGISVAGIRLGQHLGKGVAQAIGLKHGELAPVSIFMDADGQHPATTVPELLSCIESGATAVVVSRIEYRRGTVAALGTKAMTALLFVLGGKFDDSLSEFVAINGATAMALRRSPRFGIVPLVPVIQAHVDKLELVTAPMGVREGAGTKNRWPLSALWHKALLNILADPWSLLPRITIIAVISVLILSSFALLAGFQFLSDGSAPGTVVVLASIVILAVIMLAMWIASIVVSVMTLRLLEFSRRDFPYEASGSDAARSVDS